MFDSVKELSYEIGGLSKETEWPCKINSSLVLFHSVQS